VSLSAVEVAEQRCSKNVCSIGITGIWYVGRPDIEYKFGIIKEEEKYLLMCYG
jgi:hypothetical protein